MEKHKVIQFNMRLWQEGMDYVVENVCSSALHIKMFNYIKSKADKHGQIIISAKELMDVYDVSRVYATKFIKKLVDIGFIHKEKTNTYIVNPFVMMPKGMKLEDCEAAQQWWANEYKLPNKDLQGGLK